MISICFLNKAEKNQWLPRMFALLYENMNEIAPSDLTYEEEWAGFLSNVSPALEKAPRQVLLALEEGDLVGYVQYYTRQELLMVEEIQIRKDHQGSLLFLCLCRHLLGLLPEEIRVVEAYADPRNRNSIGIMEKLGMTPVQEEAMPFAHLRGGAETMKKRFTHK